MTGWEKAKLITAEVLARVVVFGGVGAGAFFAGMGVLPFVALAMGAGQPWVGQEFTKVAQLIQKKAPAVFKVINPLMSKVAGANWMTHFGALTAVVVGALAMPKIFDKPILKAVTSPFGGLSSVFSLATNALMFTALPVANKFTTSGLQWAFDHIPGLGNIGDLHRQHVTVPAQAAKQARNIARQAYKEARVAAKEAKALAKSGAALVDADAPAAAAPLAAAPEAATRSVEVLGVVVPQGSAAPETAAPAPPLMAKLVAMAVPTNVVRSTAAPMPAARPIPTFTVLGA